MIKKKFFEIDSEIGENEINTHINKFSIRFL